MTLTSMQLLAIDAYMKGSTMRDAMREAGYSEDLVQRSQENIFRNPAVIAEVEKRRKKIMQRNALTEDWIVQRLMDIAGSSVGELLVIDEAGNPHIDYSKMSPELQKSLSTLTIDEYTQGRGAGAQKMKKIKVQQADRLRALEMLGKILGMFTEKVEVSVESNLIAKRHEGRSRVGAST